MAAQFKVSGELSLNGQQFVASAREAKTGLEGVDQAGRKVAATAEAVTASTTAEAASLGKVGSAAKDAAPAIAGVEQSAKKAASAGDSATVSTTAEAASLVKVGVAAKEAAAALGTVEQANRKAASAADAAVSSAAAQATATARLAQEHVAAAAGGGGDSPPGNIAAMQAAGYARLALQRQIDEATAKSQATMAAVAQSNEYLLGLYDKTGKAATTAAAGNATLAASAKKVKAANDDSAKSVETVATKLTAYQKTQLSFQLNDVFTSAVGGMNPLMIAAQQGPQITQVFGGVGNMLRAIPLATAGAAAGIGLVVGATIGLIVHLNALNASQRQTEIALQATGRAAQLTASQFQMLVRSEAERPGAGRQDTEQAALQLLGNGQLTGQALGQTLSLARDLARVTGQDLPTAAAALSSGLDGTVAGALKLDAAFNALTPRELEQIKRYAELGDKGAAIGVMLTALTRNLANANERGVGPLEKVTAELRASWQGMLDVLSNSTVINFAAAALRQLALPLIVVSQAAKAIKDLGAGGEAPTAEDVARNRASLDQARQQLEQLRAQRATASPFKYPQLDNSIAAAEANVRNLESALADAERRSAAIAQKTGSDAAKGQATAANNDLKDLIALLDKSSTIAGQRRALEGELAQLQSKAGSGLLDPDTLARINERITTVRGSLAALRTPAEELQRALDQQTQLASLPAHQAAALQAYLDTYRQMLEATGDKDKALKAAEQARSNVLQSQATATGQQIQLLSAEAQAALKVADAYGVSRASALQLQAQLKAQAAEEQGQIAGGTAGAFAQQTLEEDAASAIATAAAKNEAYGREVAALGRLVDAEAQGSAAAREAERANKVATVAEDLRAQAAATGSAAIVAAAERQIAAYDAISKKEMARNVQRDAQGLNAQYDPDVAAGLDRRKLEELQATGLLTARTVEEYTRQSEQRRLEASRDATDGMIAGLRRYADEATNAGQAAADGVKAGAQAMEDALVSFVTTGKLTVTDLANSIIADFARVAIRQTITGPLAQGLSGVLGSALGSLFGGNPNAGGFATVGSGAGSTNGYPNFSGMHTGGIVGRDASFTRALDPRAFDGAPRYHTGGIAGLQPNERAIIALEDEEVITRSDPRHRWNLGAGGGGMGGGMMPPVNVSFANYGAPAQERSRQVTQNGSGGLDVRIVIEAVEKSLAHRVAAGMGPLGPAVASTYGLTRQARKG